MTNILLIIIIALLIFSILLVIYLYKKLDNGLSFISLNKSELDERFDVIQDFLISIDVFDYILYRDDIVTNNKLIYPYETSIDKKLSCKNIDIKEELEYIILYSYNIEKLENFLSEMKKIYRKVIIGEISTEEGKKIIKSFEFVSYYSLLEFKKEKLDYLEKEYKKLYSKFINQYKIKIT